MFSIMERMIILTGNILLLGGIPVETLSSRCRCTNHTDEPNPVYNSRNDCDLIPTRETVDKFKAFVQTKKKAVILLNVTFSASDCERQILNARNDCNDKDDSFNHVIFPYYWTWVYKGQDGMFPLMTYPYDYIIHSLWTLNNTNIVLKSVLTIPKNCSIRIGDTSLLRMVFQSLKSMTQPLMQPDWEGYLCYDVDISYLLSRESMLYHHFFGFVRGVTVKYCCHLRNETKKDQPLDIDTGGEKNQFCSGDIVPTTMLMNLTIIIGAVMLLFLPFIVFFFLREEDLSDVVSPDATYKWVNTHDGFFSFQHLMRWLFWWDHPSLLASRIRRILFVLFSPFIIYYHIIIEYFYMSDVQNEYINRNIPLGVKSVVFGFDQNYQNTYGFLGGTFSWYFIHITLSLYLIYQPKNIGNAIMGRMKFQEKSSWTFLILDARTLKRYSSIDITGLENYRLVYETLKANMLIVLNYCFWISVIYKWKIRVKKLLAEHNPKLFIFNICLTIIYAFLFIVEAISCVCYYGCPLIFIFFSINVSIYEELESIFIGTMPRHFKPVSLKVFTFILKLSIFITYFIFLYVFLSMIYLYLSSLFILNATIMFTLVGVIITPEYISYLVYVSSAIFYIHILYKSFIDKYTALLYLIAKTPSKYSVKIKNIQFVRRDFLYDVAEHILPLRSEIFLLLTKYFVLFLYLSMSYNIIRKYQLNLQYTEKILSCLLITQVPKIVITILSKLMSKSPYQKFNEHEYVKYTLKHYHSNGINESELNCEFS